MDKMERSRNTTPNVAETGNTEGMRFHSSADLLPLLEGPAFRELVNDIKANGQREPIVMLDGKILDGRNRYRACRELEITPIFQLEEWRPSGEDDTPIKFVISRNVTRRHLRESQRAMIAARLANMHQGRPSCNPANLPLISQKDAAKMLAVSERLVRDAKAVLDAGIGDLTALVEQDRLPASTALAFIQIPENTKALAPWDKASTAGSGEDAVRVAIRKYNHAKAKPQPEPRPDRMTISKVINTVFPKSDDVERSTLRSDRSLSEHIVAIWRAVQEEGDHGQVLLRACRWAAQQRPQ
jgi:ParB-like nuclease domain